MPKSHRPAQRAKGLVGIPWLAADGSLDPARFPIEGLLQQALDRGCGSLRTACTMLQSLCSHGRTEAGVYLLGLLRFYQDDLERLAVIVESLAAFRTPQAAEALFNELRRVKSDNSTRRYLASVLRTLSLFPRDFVEGGLRALAEDKSFSSKMRHKFGVIVEELYWNSAGGA